MNDDEDKYDLEQEEADFDSDDEAYTYAVGAYAQMNAIHDYLRQHGWRELAITELPGESPPFVGDTTTMSERDLERLYDQCGQWYEYLSQEVMILRDAVDEADKKLTAKKSHGKLTDGEKPKTDRDLRLQLSRGFINVSADHLQLKRMHRAMETRLNNVRKSMERISRHFSIRMDGADQFSRRENVRNFRPGQQPTYLRKQRRTQGNDPGDTSK